MRRDAARRDAMRRDAAAEMACAIQTIPYMKKMEKGFKRAVQAASHQANDHTTINRSNDSACAVDDSPAQPTTKKSHRLPTWDGCRARGPWRTSAKEAAQNQGADGSSKTRDPR